MYQPWHKRHSVPSCCPNLTMVNAQKTNLLPQPVGISSKLTNLSTRRHHLVNENKSCFNAEWVWTLGALRSIKFSTMLTAVKWWQMHVLSNKEKEKWIEGYVDRDPAVERQRVQDTETGTMQEQKDNRNAEKVRSTTRKPDTAFEEM